MPRDDNLNAQNDWMVESTHALHTKRPFRYRWNHVTKRPTGLHLQLSIGSSIACLVRVLSRRGLYATYAYQDNKAAWKFESLEISHKQES